MSHLHIPDGVLPVWFWVAGLVVTLGIVLFSLKKLEEKRRMVPAVAVMAAVVLVALNIPLGLPLHLNLAALAGIILGPLFGFLAVFIVNLFSALIAHGGLTVLGVNTLLVGSEALIAGSLFLMLGGAKKLLTNSAVAVVVALLISTLLVVGAAGIAGMELEAMVEDRHHDDHGHDESAIIDDHDQGHGFFETFIKIIAPLVALWMAIELGLTVLVVKYVNKVKGGWFARG
jgi:cobalt/nickel transport system permease protein